MDQFEHLKPIYRSKIRANFGRKYYTYRRYIEWFIHHRKFAKQNSKINFDFCIIKHQTPLYRPLKNVDMWLQHNKVNNLKIAIRQIDGIIIKPGETFSYWKLIGNPTASKGYKDGMVLHYGSFKAGVGGGLCQLSNLIYWLTLHTPLTVTERHRHSFDVFPDANRTQPFGSGATCVYNYRDLRILNDTDEDYQIRLFIENDYLVGTILSSKPQYFKYNIYEKNHKFTLQFWGAYVRHNEIRRVVKNMNNDKIIDEHVCENHALMMYEPLLEAGDSALTNN